MKKILSLCFLLLAGILQGSQAVAQCAMCRATVENNVSNGEVGIAASLNFGILYLFVFPYITIGVIGYLWYKHSKRNAGNIKRRSYFKG